MRSHPLRRPLMVGLPFVLALGIAPIASHALTHSSDTAQLAIQTLSDRSDLISGGDALARVTLPTGVDPAAVRVLLNGVDVTGAFGVRRDGGFEGVLTGLRLGANTVTATDAVESATLTVTNHPIGGPVFAGPQIQPWACQSGAVDAQCDQPPTYTYYYMPRGATNLSGGVTGVASASAFQPYNPASPPPSTSIATAMTTEGRPLPFIVRLETGYIDRDQYQVATLFRPGQPWSAVAPQPQYNGRLVITHGASCDTTYGSGSAPSVLDPKVLRGGFVVMSNALDNAGHNCNLATQAESLVMTKEYVVDHYGPVTWTIGMGCSGGSLVQQQVANAYPGIYQGITPQCSFTDAWSSAMEYVDYVMLLDYFKHPTRWAPGTVWTPTAIQQVLDHPNVGNPVTFTTVIPNSGDPSRSCPDVPADQVYDPKTNPDGVKCTLQDYMVNVFGKRPDGFANRAFGNDGIQYGLQGLMNGELTAQQFVDLNTKVGGLTYDGTYQPARSKPDPLGLARAYRSGGVDSANNLNQVAIIDLRGPDPGFFHDVYRTYAMRARLLRDFGTAANQVLWRGQAPIAGDANFADEAVYAVDKWLARVHADDRTLSLPQKILLDKPVDLVDRCTDGVGHDLPSWGCDQTVASYGTPRMAAGMPIADDTLECQLQPMNRADYPVSFTDAQWAALQKAFPNGVCNYNVPGVDQGPAVSWLTYQTSSGDVVYGGTPLGPAPTSTIQSASAGH
ncbi:MAG: DUF6351 family protein [Actinomycetes bacterium]